MRLRRCAVMVPLLAWTLLGGDARGQQPLDSADEVTQPLLQALEAEKLSEALRLGSEISAAHPDHAGAHALYGYALIDVARLPEAIAELEKSLELAPDNRDAAVRLGYLLWQTDDTPRAREVAARALQRWPDDPMVQELDFNLRTDERIRTGKRETHEPGSAEQLVDDFCQEVASAGLGQAVVKHVDSGVLATIMSQAGITGTDAERKRKLSEKLELAWKAALADQRDTYLGFEVASGVEARDGGVQGVSVNVLAKRWVMKEELASLRTYLEHPDQPGLVAPEVRRILAGLNAADQQRYVDALGSRATMEFVHIDFAVARHDPNWRVLEVVVDGRISLSNLGSWVNLMDRRDSSAERASTDLPYGLGRLVGFAVVFALIAVAVRWARNRFGGSA